MKKTILFILIISCYNSIFIEAQFLPKYMDTGHKTSPFLAQPVSLGLHYAITPGVGVEDRNDETAPEIYMRQYMPQIQQNVATSHSARTTAEDPWTTLGMNEINYNLEDQDYTDTVTRMVRMYVDQNPTEYRQYYTKATTGGTPDTIKVEYKIYDNNLEWMVLDLAWEKINGQLVPTRRNIGYHEWQTDNNNTVYMYDTSYTTYVDSYLDNGIRIKYILSERLLISKENGIHQFYRSTTRRKDGSFSNILEEKTEHQNLIYRSNINYDAAGNVIAGEKDTVHYDATGRITYELHQISSNGTEWTDSYEYILELDSEGRILVETILGGTREKSTFTWNEDKVESVLVEKKYNNLSDPWKNYQKYAYVYFNNSTQEFVDYWDLQDEQWHPAIKYTYTGNLTHNGQNLWISSRADYKIPEEEYKTISIDSVYYTDHVEQPFSVYSYARNGDLFLLSKWEEMARDEQGRYIERIEYNGAGYASKSVFDYKDPYNPNRATLEESYTATEIVNQQPVNWKLMSRLYNDYHQYKKEGFRLTDNMNWGSVNGGFYWRIILNNDGQTSRIQSTYTSDTNGDDGIDWWVKYDDVYTYDTNKKLVKIENFKRDSEVQPFTPTFFSEWTYHDNGLQDAFYSSYHDLSSIRRILKNQWLYNTDPISTYCKIEVLGDTLITEDKVTLEAVFNSGSPQFKWTNENGTDIGNENMLDIDIKGQYALQGIKAGCLSQISFDIYSLCDVIVSGDTILYRNSTAQATAALADVSGGSYTWFNEFGEIAGHSAVLSASQPGLYDVEASGDHCYGTNSHRIAMVTEIEDQALIHELRLYPNPNNGSFIVEPVYENATERMLVSILDLSGRNIKDLEVCGNGKQYEIDLTGIMKGTYLLKISSGEEIFSRRILIE